MFSDTGMSLVSTPGRQQRHSQPPTRGAPLINQRESLQPRDSACLSLTARTPGSLGQASICTRVRPTPAREAVAQTTQRSGASTVMGRPMLRAAEDVPQVGREPRQSDESRCVSHQLGIKLLAFGDTDDTQSSLRPLGSRPLPVGSERIRPPNTCANFRATPLREPWPGQRLTVTCWRGTGGALPAARRRCRRRRGRAPAPGR